MTTFLLTLYFIGLGLMLLGLVMSPRQERQTALLWPTALAYVFWPISLAVVVGYVARERMISLADGGVASEHAFS